MNTNSPVGDGSLVHVVTLDCKDGAHAKRCLDALAFDPAKDTLRIDLSRG